MPANECSQIALDGPRPLTLHALLLELVPAALGLPGLPDCKISLAAPRRCAASRICSLDQDREHFSRVWACYLLCLQFAAVCMMLRSACICMDCIAELQRLVPSCCSWRLVLIEACLRSRKLACMLILVSDDRPSEAGSLPSPTDPSTSAPGKLRPKVSSVSLL